MDSPQPVRISRAGFFRAPTAAPQTPPNALAGMGDSWQLLAKNGSHTGSQDPRKGRRPRCQI